MSKSHSPLLGFNTNVKHKGKVFHIQTEDSGVKRPHIITHLFADGGRILKSLKTSYSDRLDEDDLTETVRALMKEQHKTMFMALRDGEFDSLIDDALAANRPAARAAGAGPLEAAAASPAAEVAVPGAATTVTAQPAAPQPASAKDAAPRPEAAALARPPMPSQPGEQPTFKPGINVDLDVLNRAAAADGDNPGVFQAAADMPPPPPGLLSPRRPAGSYAMTSGSTPQSQPASGDQNARYAASRPASIFASSRPTEGGTVFGEDLISDKSLDEVILSFLSEEIGGKADEEDKNGRR